MSTTDDMPDGEELDHVQRKIDDARDQARDHGSLPESDVELDEEQEEAIDGLSRPGLG